MELPGLDLLDGDKVEQSVYHYAVEEKANELAAWMGFYWAQKWAALMTERLSNWKGGG